MIEDLAARLLALGGALRSHGVPVTIGDEIDAAHAHAFVDSQDRAETQRALRISLKIRRGQEAAFERLFACFWAGLPYPTRRAQAPDAPASPRETSGGRFLQWDPETASIGSDTPTREQQEADTPGYSPAALLRKKPFASCSPEELLGMQRLIARLARRLATRPTRRLVPARTRGLIDPRRSFRRAIQSGGEFVSPARRRRAVEAPRLVFLCDVSGSMDGHARFLLSLVLALETVAPRTEAFAFDTRLTRLTPWLAPNALEATLARLSAGVESWGGGTRIGECLSEFVLNHAARMLDRRTVVVILSDGLDRGDVERLRLAMRAIRARARRVIWLNPLAGDPRYRPLARGMDAALPYVDRFGAAHDRESLERLLPALVS